MRLYGQITELVRVVWRKATGFTVTLEPTDATGGNATVSIPDPAGTNRTLVTTDQTQTLTQKSIDADANTISNIDNADIKALAGIDATKIHDGSVDNTEFGYLNGVTSSIQTQLNTTSTGLSDHLSDTTDAHDASAISNVPAGNLSATDVQAALNELQTDIDGRQPLDSDLTALAGVSSNGLLARTGGGTAAPRTLTAGSSKVTVTNGDGVSGNPTVDVSESNLALNNISGILNPNKGGTGVNNGSATLTVNNNTTLTTSGVTNVTLPTTGTLATLGGVETFSGSKTFSNAVTISVGSNQLILSSGVNQLTLNSGTSSAARTYAVPDVGASGAFAMLEGNQTFTGTKTFPGAIFSANAGFATGTGVESQTAAATLNIGTTANTATLNLGTSSSTQVVNIGTGAGTTTINIGGSGDTVNIAGTLTTVNTTNLDVTDKLIRVNDGGAAASGDGSGIEVEEDGSATGYVKVGSSRTAWEIKAPARASTVSIIPSNTAAGTFDFSSVTSTRTFTLPDVTGTLVTTGDSGSVTGTMIASGTTITNPALGRVRLPDTNVSTAGPALALQAGVVTYRLQAGFGATLSTVTGGNDGDYVVIVNETGAALTVTNNVGTNGLYTGTGANLDIQDDSAITCVFDTGSSRWNVMAGGGSGGLRTSYVAASVNPAVNNTHYLVDSTGGARTITLPASPQAGSVIRVSDEAGTAATNNITVARNGNNIDDLAEDFIIDVANGWAQFMWTGSDWTVDTLAVDASSGILSLNGLSSGSAPSQTFATGTSGTDFNIASSGTIHTFNIPDASTTNRGLVTTGAQTFAGAKTFNGGLTLGGGSAANLSMWSASNVLRLRGGTSGFAVDNTSGTAILSATDAGAWTLGSVTDDTAGSFHTTYKNIFTGTPSTATQFFGSIYIGANAYLSSAAQPTRLTGLTGSVIKMFTRTADNTTAFAIATNLVADSATTGSTDKFAITAAGAVTLGPTTEQVHTSNGALRFPISSLSLTGTQNAMAIGNAGVIRTTNAAGYTLNGIASGVDGRILYLINTAGTVTINDENGGAAAGDRIRTGDGLAITVTNEGTVTLIYDGTQTRWRVLAVRS